MAAKINIDVFNFSIHTYFSPFYFSILRKRYKENILTCPSSKTTVPYIFLNKKAFKKRRRKKQHHKDNLEVVKFNLTLIIINSKYSAICYMTKRKKMKEEKRKK